MPDLLKALDFSNPFDVKAPSFHWRELFLFCSAQEVKEHPFFKGIDWQQVYLQKVKGWETVTYVLKQQTQDMPEQAMGTTLSIPVPRTGTCLHECMHLNNIN